MDKQILESIAGAVERYICDETKSQRSYTKAMELIAKELPNCDSEALTPIMCFIPVDRMWVLEHRAFCGAIVDHFGDQYHNADIRLTAVVHYTAMKQILS